MHSRKTMMCDLMGTKLQMAKVAGLGAGYNVSAGWSHGLVSFIHSFNSHSLSVCLGWVLF